MTSPRNRIIACLFLVALSFGTASIIEACHEGLRFAEPLPSELSGRTIALLILGFLALSVGFGAGARFASAVPPRLRTSYVRRLLLEPLPYHGRGPLFVLVLAAVQVACVAAIQIGDGHPNGVEDAVGGAVSFGLVALGVFLVRSLLEAVPHIVASSVELVLSWTDGRPVAIDAKRPRPRPFGSLDHWPFPLGKRPPPTSLHA